ncbi:hypothetical protein DXG03_005888 [Asterophora parasitica]|uniref:SLC41A/MgtE integral membrane domain-containing protein n=1 Tax=Asterophora parasitica TaxID=117018 RepID=A0A9P7G1M3_9AGAR|nr:hypothetical protein DXG03_005888 [Asterophora parasitica]
MNPQSPGKGSLDEDIEMIGLEDVVKSSQSLHQNGGLRTPGAEDSDDEDDHGDDGRQALLGFDERPGRHERLTKSVGTLWPQVKNIVVESAPTLLFTTVGLLFTGKLMDQVDDWRAMSEVHQLIMIIPVILNLKGNLEMNLSARLGTAANVGELDDPALRRSLISGNLSLLQVQAAVVSFIAAWIAVVIGLALPHISTPTSPEDTFPANVTTRAIVESSILEPRRPISLPPKDSSGTFTFAK